MNPFLRLHAALQLITNVLPNQPDTKFNIVSVTKMLTAVAVMQLELMGNTGYVVLGTVIEQVTGKSFTTTTCAVRSISRWACRIPTTMKWTSHHELCDRLYSRKLVRADRWYCRYADYLASMASGPRRAGVAFRRPPDAGRDTAWRGDCHRRRAMGNQIVGYGSCSIAPMSPRSLGLTSPRWSRLLTGRLARVAVPCVKRSAAGAKRHRPSWAAVVLQGTKRDRRGYPDR